jgi:hypothetical protein
MIVTFRPEFDPPWIGRPYVTAVTINRLAQRDIEAMIDGVVGNKFIPESVSGRDQARPPGTLRAHSAAT